MLLIAVITAYLLAGLLISRWSYKSGAARRIANSIEAIEDQPFRPSFIAFWYIPLWLPLLIVGLLLKFVYWFYGEESR